jgi:hypothetical protein
MLLNSSIGNQPMIAAVEAVTGLSACAEVPAAT